MLDAATAGLGISVTALLFDHFGNYQVAFNLLCVLRTIALAAATQVGKEREASVALKPAASAAS